MALPRKRTNRKNLAAQAVVENHSSSMAPSPRLSLLSNNEDWLRPSKPSRLSVLSTSCKGAHKPFGVRNRNVYSIQNETDCCWICLREFKPGQFFS